MFRTNSNRGNVFVLGKTVTINPHPKMPITTPGSSSYRNETAGIVTPIGISTSPAIEALVLSYSNPLTQYGGSSSYIANILTKEFSI